MAINREVDNALALITYGPEFIHRFKLIAAEANKNARAKGFWDDYDGSMEVLAGTPGRQWLHSTAIQAAIARMHSELSEALEGVRHDNPPDSHLPAFNSLETELADVIIRIMDLSVELDLDVGDAIIAKMKFNAERPYKHGKNS